jgi:hypothetical protein
MVAILQRSPTPAGIGCWRVAGPVGVEAEPEAGPAAPAAVEAEPSAATTAAHVAGAAPARTPSTPTPVAHSWTISSRSTTP